MEHQDLEDLSRKIKVAVARDADSDFTIEDLTLRKIKQDEILVKIVGVGLCHTDLVAKAQQIPFPLPAILGHEGSGIIEAVGAEVKDHNVGDHVVLTFASCGTCPACKIDNPAYCDQFPVYNLGGTEICCSNGTMIQGGFFGQSSFASYAITKPRNIVKVSKEIPLELLGPLGCGIQTGAGAVLNSLKPSENSSIAIFGAGTVGLSAVLGAVVAGCSPIIVIDTKPERLALARSLGATDTLLSDANIAQQIKTLTDNLGVTYSLECTGIPAVLRQAVDSLAPLGECGIVGVAASTAEVSLNINHLLAGRTVKGIMEGDSDPYTFIPHLIDLWQQGKFPFDQLITQYRLEEINEAVSDSASGKIVKAVLLP